MIKTCVISRSDLKAKRYKQAEIKQIGDVPVKRDPTLLVQVLKKALNP